MRSVALKALAVGLVSLMLALIAPGSGGQAWAQQVPVPPLQGDLVRVLSTSWENNIMADPPVATIMPLPGDLIFGGVPWLSFLSFPGQPLPVPAQGYCFRVWTGQAEFMGQMVSGVVRYQRAPCPGSTVLPPQPQPPPVPPPAGSNRDQYASITTDRGCQESRQNPIFYQGEQITVSLQVNGAPIVLIRLWNIVNGQARLVFQGLVPGSRLLRLVGRIGPPTGAEILRMEYQAQVGPIAVRGVVQCSFRSI